MSVTRQITVWCDQCSKWEQMSTSSVAKLRRLLKAKGWTVRGRPALDYCPDCSKTCTRDQSDTLK